MRITISTVEGADGAALTSLYGWLRRDEDVVRTATVALAKPDVPTGAMDAVQLIDVAFTQTTALLNLATACLAWRRARRTEVKITLRLGSELVTLDGSPDAVAKLMALRPDEAPDTAPTGDRSDGTA